MTGQETPIQIINKSGNFYSYEAVLKVKSAQALLSQELSQQKNHLIKSDQPGKHVITFLRKYSYKAHSTSVRSINSITLCGKEKLLMSRHVIYQ